MAASITDDARRGAGDTPAVGHPLLAMLGIEKRYGGVRALRGADLTLTRPGVVHTLMGENGSGKSTLLGILSGQTRPDEGTITIDSTPVAYRSPAEAVSQGVVMVSQETAVAPDLTVAENVLVGRRLVRTRAGIDWPASRRRAREVLERLHLDYDPELPVGRLRPDQQQMIEIARAVSMDARILILDEPTSSLTDDEVQSLFGVIAELKEVGVATVFVSHRLDEVFAIGDHVTVLRDGASVARGPLSDFDRDSLVQAMLGDAKALAVRHAAPRALSAADVALEVRQMSEPGVLDDVSLQVRSGEIVGLAGLVGAGRSELLRGIFGERGGVTGEVVVDGDVLGGADARRAILQGVAYLPPDRKSQGLVLTMSVVENLSMVATHRRARLRSPNPREEGEMASTAMKAMNIRAASPHVPVSTLSGGNQQKVALGKWLVRPPKVMLLDEPTRGVDVNAKGEIHQQLRQLADQGVAILVSSSENEELLDLCDRIIVMSRGAVKGDLSRADASLASLAQLTGGAAAA